MRETAEFRIPEEYARKYLYPHEGRVLGSAWQIELAGPSIRALEIDTISPRYEQIGLIYRHLRDRGEYFFHGWELRRRYTKKEIDSAELFHLLITSVFEPAGEECGTVYDESDVCSFCRAGRRQASDLILDIRRVPKNKHIVRTIADEWIVSQQLAELLIESKVSGIELGPVRHKSRYQDDPIDLRNYPTGRELMRKAGALGYKYQSWEFDVWLNRPEQNGLFQRAKEEQIAAATASQRRRPTRLPPWYQLMVTSVPARTIHPTTFGIKPFEDDIAGKYHCPLDHVSGLNLLSEVWIRRTDWDGSDVIRTANLVGAREGVLVATPLLLISPRLYGLLRDNSIRGFKVEVAHLI